MKMDRLKIGEKNILFFYYIFYIGTIQVKATVKDASGLALSNANVDIVIGGPETVTLTSNPSDASGIAEAHWQTQKPNKRGQGGTAVGTYTASTTDVTVTGYHWDGVTTSTTFFI